MNILFLPGWSDNENFHVFNLIYRHRSIFQIVSHHDFYKMMFARNDLLSSSFEIFSMSYMEAVLEQKYSALVLQKMGAKRRDQAKTQPP